MTSVESYIFGMNLANQPVNGGFPIARFQDFYNQAQREYMGRLTKDGVDASIMANEALSPFFVNSTIALTDGIGFHNPLNDLAFGPTISASGYSNPACGETNAGDSIRIPVPLLREKAWWDRQRNLIDVTSMSNPVARVLDTLRIEVRPKAMKFCFAWYVRYANPIVVGSFTDANGIQRPLEGAPGQVDPEWGDIDNIEIIWIAMGYTGLALQNDRMQMTAGRYGK